MICAIINLVNKSNKKYWESRTYSLMQQEWLQKAYFQVNVYL